jgi:hypothetical protein
MKRWIATLLMMAIVLCGVGLTLTAKPDAAAGDEIVAADRTLTQAFEKGDKATIQKWLHPEFTWIDQEGIMWPMREALEAGLKPLVLSSSDVNVVEHKYGNVVWLQVSEGKKYAAHFWVKQGNTWKLLHITEISVHARDFTTVRPNYDVPCINPCAAIPYKALTENEKAALAGWQEQESGPRELWAKHIADNFDQRAVMTWGGPRAAKKDLVAQQARMQQQNAGRPEVAAVPFLWSRWWDFGSAVVMISVQPTYGDKAYWASRVFAPLDGVWMMMESYHNYIDSSPVMTAVPLDQSKDPRGLKMLSTKKD